MRTVTSSYGEDEPISVRRAECFDAPHISNLISPTTVATFGRLNVTALLERANFAVTVTNDKDEVLAHASFLDYPCTELVDQACWESWLTNHYSFDKCTPLNTLFLHLYVAQPESSVESAENLVKTAFNALPELHYMLLVTLNSTSIDPALLKLFRQIRSLQESVPPSWAFLCCRESHLPRLHVRKARVEDHDDLTPILAEQTEALITSYGPYFLAELIEAQDEDHHTAVCEDEDRAVGFINVSTDVNIELLNQCFKLELFNGLRKPTEEFAEPTEPSADTGTESASSLECNSESEAPLTEQDDTPKPAEIGAPNAFCIQLFFIDKAHEMRSADFLPYVFKLFPDRDFCIISVPSLAKEFPLLQMCLRVVPKSTSTLPHDLYIFHRGGMLKSFIVQPAITSDRPKIEALVNSLSLQRELLQELDLFYEARRDVDGTPIQAFVALVQEQVVGILIIRKEEEIEYIQSHYSIESFIYFSHHRPEEHAQLRHFALNPIFQHYTRHFLKEALRLGHKSCLYTRQYPSCSDQNATLSLNSALSCMVPVRPRRQIIYPLEELGVNIPSAQVTDYQAPFALSHINRKLSMEPKLTVNSRIVVVGNSDTGIAFLEVLVNCSHLNFNNLTLISTHGYQDYLTTGENGFLCKSHCYDHNDHILLSLQSWIGVVEGTITGLDRAAKHVVMSEGRLVPYDQLILCTGIQYQVPCPTGADLSKPSVNAELKQSGNRYTGPVPSNLLTLNDAHDCLAARNWLQENFVDGSGNAIVYGNTLDVYTCVETLLQLGIHGSRIHLIHLPSDSPGSCFSSPAIEQAVMEAMVEKEVSVYHNCLLAQFNDGQDPEPITSVAFTTDRLPLQLECSVFINFSVKDVNYNMFSILNNAHLVYDGRLVIDTMFHTNDPSICAAGPLTKYSRRYYADHYNQSLSNSKEVGQALAGVLLTFVDPTLEPNTDPAPELDELIPVYRQAKVVGGQLPGGYNYLHAEKPAICAPLTPQMLSPERTLETGNPKAGNYFCLHVNQYGAVDCITCFSTEPLLVSNYLCLYRKHETLLNRLCSRFDEGLITDFYQYFREPWCLALYHDRFVDFEEEVRQIVASDKVLVGEDLLSLSQLAQDIATGQLTPPAESMQYIQDLLGKSSSLTAVKKGMVNYLTYNRYHLPMYAQPGIL